MAEESQDDPIAASLGRAMEAAGARATKAEAEAASARAEVEKLRKKLGALAVKIEEAKALVRVAQEDKAQAGEEVLRLVEDVRRAVLRAETPCEYRLSIERRGRAIARRLGAALVEPDEVHEPYQEGGAA